MSEKTAYLSLGSNIGNREQNLRLAIGELPHAGVAITRVSSFYETEPVDLREQPWFLNCVVEAETHFDPFMLLRALREIDTKELRVPHPRMHLRRFVLVPLAEIAPTLEHPSWTKTVSALAAATTDRS